MKSLVDMVNSCKKNALRFSFSTNCLMKVIQFNDKNIEIRYLKYRKGFEKVQYGYDGVTTTTQSFNTNVNVMVLKYSYFQKLTVLVVQDIPNGSP